ncbi:MAG: chloride channel protein, partial [Bacteroidaceae bacterium]|nr:chloride channel protein [Bacteroidaceae bacterium]
MYTAVRDSITQLKRRFSERRLLIILSLAVGFFAAVAGLVLHWIIKHVQLLLTQHFDPATFNWLYMLYPAIGILVTALFVRYVVRDHISHGITRILYAISRKRSFLKVHNCWSSVVASAITIGCGGSVGAEAPIVLTGSAIGSNLGRLFGLDNKMLMVLVGCGAAAAIAGVFKAPMAGLVFTLEVLMIDLTMAALLPILIASVTATCFTYIFMGSESMFHFTLDSDWTVQRIPATILLGAFCGLVSLYFMRAMAFTEG